MMELGRAAGRKVEIKDGGGKVPQDEASPQYGYHCMKLQKGREEVNCPFVFV